MPVSSNERSEMIIAIVGGENLSVYVQEMWWGGIHEMSRRAKGLSR